MTRGGFDPGFGGVSGEAIASRVRSHAFTTGIAAGLLLFFGFARDPVGISGDPLYDGSVAVFAWTLKIGGVTLAVATVLCWFGTRWGLLLDGAASLPVGAVLLGTGGIWIVYGDLQGFLMVLFSLMFLHAGRGSILEFRTLGPATPAGSADRASEEEIPTAPLVSGEHAAVAALAKLKARAAAEPETRVQPAPTKPGKTDSTDPEIEAPPEPAVEEPQEKQDQPPVEPSDEGPPPEGFLAALAKEHPSKKEQKS